MLLIIGSNGQLGREMQRALTKRGLAFCAYDYPDVDITRPDTIETLLRDRRIGAIINCAGYTNVDKAETDYDAAYRVNALGPENLAVLSRQYDTELVHISTDYVFSGLPVMENGTPRPYIESDACDPLNAYGRTKLEGDRLVAARHHRFYILRTAWMYGDGRNFVGTMLRLAREGKTIRVVNDQIGSPTSARDLAEAVCSLLGTGEYGLYHATCEGYCSWYDFARKIFEIRGMDVEVIPVSSEEYASPARRPLWSVLENANLKSAGRNVFRSWEEALREYLSVQ